MVNFLDNNSFTHPAVKYSMLLAEQEKKPYESDPSLDTATEVLRMQFGNHARVYFFESGSAANVTAMKVLLSPNGSILGSESAHINTLEGNSLAVVAGRTFRGVFSDNGKLNPILLQSRLESLRGLGGIHSTYPELLTITIPTEEGLAYTLDELIDLGQWCRINKIHFHIDAARLPYQSALLNLSYKELTTNIGASVITIDCSKIGGCGSALVFLGLNQQGEPIESDNVNIKAIKESYSWHDTNHWRIGASFKALWAGDLALRIAQRANTLGRYIQYQAKELGLNATGDCNSVFIRTLLPQNAIEELQSKYLIYNWKPAEGVIRVQATYSTTEDDIDTFMTDLKKILLKYPRNPS
jgi:threonine aldolase